MFEVVVELGLEGRIAARGGISGLDREHQRHQGLGDKAPAIDAEMAALVGTAAKGVRSLHLPLLTRRKMHHEGREDTDKNNMPFPRAYAGLTQGRLSASSMSLW